MKLDTELEKSHDGYFIKTKLSVSEIADILNNLSFRDLEDLCFDLNDLTTGIIVETLYPGLTPDKITCYFENTFEDQWKEAFDKLNISTTKQLKEFLKKYDRFK